MCSDQHGLPGCGPGVSAWHRCQGWAAAADRPLLAVLKALPCDRRHTGPCCQQHRRELRLGGERRDRRLPSERYWIRPGGGTRGRRHHAAAAGAAARRPAAGGSPAIEDRRRRWIRGRFVALPEGFSLPRRPAEFVRLLQRQGLREAARRPVRQLVRGLQGLRPRLRHRTPLLHRLRLQGLPATSAPTGAANPFPAGHAARVRGAARGALPGRLPGVVLPTGPGAEHVLDGLHRRL